MRTTTWKVMTPVLLLLFCSPLLMVVHAEDGYYQQQQQEEDEVEAQQEDQNDNNQGYYGGQQQYYQNQADANGYYQNDNAYNNNNYYNYNNNNNQQNIEEQEEAVDQQVYDDAYDADNSAAYNTFSVCSDAVIKVLDLAIYCDSPGTFYYGSGKYRNNPSCKPGDKAKIQLDFYIAEPDVIQSSGGYAILDISATGNSGWYQQNIKVFENADMCSTSSLKKLSGSTCPFQGKYRIRSHFYWPEDNYGENAFYPVVTVGFKSSVKSNQYDYGGANTPYCRGSTFVTWTEGIRTTYANAISNFMTSFGILLLTIILMGGFIWFLVKKPTSIKDAGLKLGVVKQDVFADEKFDFSSMRSPRNEPNLVDF
ncbi:hypothetical protein IV203_006528 [Nitzschia inconspicua]|uniref:Autophagy-related protein 27 n=1 Tax=Nitzschia inconspicua TaxID=303405 RepID=A0A9K3K9E1_9STRA|nr:hypothetical protein IV203_006605 [Nitzschia inconspicua]KAG7340124.1 hypothetical protein IV203_006528 [Nitzschia inconspicua]